MAFPLAAQANNLQTREADEALIRSATVKNKTQKQEKAKAGIQAEMTRLVKWTQFANGKHDQLASLLLSIKRQHSDKDIAYPASL